MNGLVKLSDCPTHRLSIKLEDEYKIIYLTNSQAKSVLQNINSKDQFIVIDGEAYPKFAARVQKLSEEDRRERESKYLMAAKMQGVKEAEIAVKKKGLENYVRFEKWREANPDKWEQVLVEVLNTDEFKNFKQNFGGSENMRKAVAGSRGRKIVFDKYLNE